MSGTTDTGPMRTQPNQHASITPTQVQPMGGRVQEAAPLPKQNPPLCESNGKLCGINRIPLTSLGSQFPHPDREGMITPLP
jgi:hypothetical protein